MAEMTKTIWVELFKEAGLSDKQMHDWHHAFETKYPELHEGFLKWINLSDDEVASIRNSFK